MYCKVYLQCQGGLLPGGYYRLHTGNYIEDLLCMDYLLPILLVMEDLLYTLYCATSVSQHRVDPQLCLVSHSDLASLCFLLTDILPVMEYQLFPVSWRIYVCCHGNSIIMKLHSIRFYIFTTTVYM